MKVLPVLAQSVLRVLLAALAVAITCSVLIAFRGFFSTPVVALLYLLVVVLCTTAGRFVTGIAASIFSFLPFNYFFFSPFYTFTVAHSQDVVALFVFLFVAVVISNLMGRAQTRLEQIQAREIKSMS